ncbi:MAG: type II toxin-antitoxin system Phd/YefM family antitoxin [Candidatus Dormibacteraceae bacterium]
MVPSIGIRALKINAGAVVHRVRMGERVQITDRGQPVAIMIPWRPESNYDRLIDEGVLIPPRKSGGLQGWQPLPRKEGQQLSDLLLAMRDEERY